MLSKVRMWGSSWSKGRTAASIFGREPSNDYFITVQFLLSKWFQTRRFYWEFPIGFNVKLSLAVADILVGGMKCRTHFRREPPKDHFNKVWLRLVQQFQRRRIFFSFIPLFFYFQLGGHLGWKSGSPDTILVGRGSSKDHSTKVWLQLAQWFLRRRFLCEFPIGSYVKLSQAVGAISIEGPNRRTHLWKRTIQ